MIIVLKRHIDNLIFRFLPFKWSFKPITAFHYYGIKFNLPENWFVLRKFASEEFTFYNPNLEGALQLWCYFHKDKNFTFDINEDIKHYSQYAPKKIILGQHNFIYLELNYPEINSFTMKWIGGQNHYKISISMTFNLDSSQEEKDYTKEQIESILLTLSYE